MYIHEAIFKALNTGCKIKQLSRPHIKYKPTNTPDCIIIERDGLKSSPRWNPQANDLIADDWCVVED